MTKSNLEVARKFVETYALADSLAEYQSEEDKKQIEELILQSTAQMREQAKALEKAEVLLKQLLNLKQHETNHSFKQELLEAQIGQIVDEVLQADSKTMNACTKACKKQYKKNLKAKKKAEKK